MNELAVTSECTSEFEQSQSIMAIIVICWSTTSLHMVQMERFSFTQFILDGILDLLPQIFCHACTIKFEVT